MSCRDYSIFIIIITTCFSWSYYNIINRSKLKYIIFWSCWRRRPNFISTFILIFWTSWSLYFNFTRIWYNFSYYFTRKRKKRNFWLFRNNLCYTSNWVIRIYCLSSSYIHCRYRYWYTSIFYFSYYNYCCTNRN